MVIPESHHKTLAIRLDKVGIASPVIAIRANSRQLLANGKAVSGKKKKVEIIKNNQANPTIMERGFIPLK